MTQWLWERIGAITSWWSFVPLLALTLYFTFFLFPSYQAPSFEGTRFFAPRQAATILKNLDGDRAKYLHIERSVDLIFPLVYSLTFAVAIVGVGRLIAAPRWLVLLPFVTIVFDYLENTCTISMLLRYERGAPLGPFPAICAVATPVKTILYVASWIAPLVMGIIWLIQKWGAR